MDSFADLVTKTSKRPEAQSISERREQMKASASAQAQAQASAWQGLDLLGSSQPIQPTPVANQHDLFFSAPMASTGTSTSAMSTAATYGSNSSASASTSMPVSGRNSVVSSTNASASISLIDDFDVFQSAPTTPAPQTQTFASHNMAPQTPQTQPQYHSNRTETVPQSRSSRTAAPNPVSASRNDPGVAQLVDMGFSAEDANRGLAAMNGNVRGAINWLMAEAQGAPLPKPSNSSRSHSKHAEYDVQALAADVGATVFATASSWFSKGKKTLIKAAEQYQHSSKDGPAWMTSSQRSQTAPNSWHDDTDTLPSRPDRHRSQPPRASNASVSSDSLASSGPTSNPERKSRAELFRQKQAQRGNERPVSPAPAKSSSPAPAPASAPASSQPKTRVEPVAPAAEQEFDLLGMSSQVASISTSQRDMAQSAQASGNQAFGRGDYALAASHFGTALQSLPATHNLRAVILSNRAACLLKTGDATLALKDTTEGLGLLPAVLVKSDKTMIENKFPAADLWAKLQTRQASALEQLERYDQALANYEKLLGAGHANSTLLDAKRRCQRALDPAKVSSAETTAKIEKKSQRRTWGTTGAKPTTAAGLANLQKVKDELNKAEAIEQERELYREAVGNRVSQWSQGKESDLRALLVTLHNVLWPEAGWQPVTAADLVAPRKTRIAYMKAVARVHPDKIQQNTPLEQKMIAQAVFIVLNKAWDGFREQNNL